MLLAWMATADVCVPDGDGPDVVEDDEGGEAEGVSYPLRVDYCGLCTMPPEVNTCTIIYCKLLV